MPFFFCDCDEIEALIFNIGLPTPFCTGCVPSHAAAVLRWPEYWLLYSVENCCKSLFMSSSLHWRNCSSLNWTFQWWKIGHSVRLMFVFVCFGFTIPGCCTPWTHHREQESISNSIQYVWIQIHSQCCIKLLFKVNNWAKKLCRIKALTQSIAHE